MRKRELRRPGVFLLFFISLLACVQNDIAGMTLRPKQPDRQRFFAFQILSENDVLNSKGAIGAPDERYAEIQPGGQIVVLMTQKFIDFGTLLTKGEDDYLLEGLFHMQDTGDAAQDYAWMAVSAGSQTPGGWPGGFHFDSGTINALEGGTGVDKIRITNVGANSLFVDAVIGYGKDKEKGVRH